MFWHLKQIIQRKNDHLRMERKRKNMKRYDNHNTAGKMLATRKMSALIEQKISPWVYPGLSAKTITETIKSQSLRAGNKRAFIALLVSEYFDISIPELRSQSRMKNIVNARQIGMYLMKIYGTGNLREIGEYFGGRDHSTVLYAIGTVQDLMDTEPPYRETIKELVFQVKRGL